MTDGDVSPDDLPRTEKEAAVAQWRDALDDLPPTEWAETLRSADIHDRVDRREIEEIVEHEAPQEHYLALADALHDLRAAFEDQWS